MKVLHVIESLEFGGAEAVVADLALASSSRCTVGVCCVKKSGALARRLEGKVEVLSLGKREGNDANVPLQLARILRRGGFDVVHSHMWGVYLEAALAAKLAGARLIHTVHGLYPRYPDGTGARIRLAIRHWLERRTCTWHHGIVTVSEALAGYVSESIGIDRRRLEVIYNGISPRVRVRAERPGTRFVTCGRLAEVKNHAMMLRAFARIAGSRPDISLRIIGDGPTRADLERLAGTLGISPQVQFLGFRDDAADLLEDCDCFLMSSDYEGISIAMLEAMRAGLPVVATAVGGLREIVIEGETGFLTPQGDEARFADAMARLLGSARLRSTLGEAGAARQREIFSLETVVARYSDLYAGSR